MNNACLSPIRLAIAAIVLLALLVVAGCGSDAGPSNDKIRLDLFDRINAQYEGLLQSDGFSVSDSQTMSEDRIKYHVIVSYKLDPQRAAQAERSSRLIGYTNQALKKARRNDGKDNEVTVLYKHMGQNDWQISGIQPGYH